jgi:hypothetical protein
VIWEAGADCALGDFGEVDIICNNKDSKIENEDN